jgi:hypothetical protein
MSDHAATGDAGQSLVRTLKFLKFFGLGFQALLLHLGYHQRIAKGLAIFNLLPSPAERRSANFLIL